MTISYVGAQYSDSAGAASATTPAVANTAAGDVAFVFVKHEGTTTTRTISDSAGGNTWTSRGTVDHSNGDLHTELFTSILTNGAASHTFTVTLGASRNFLFMGAVVFRSTLGFTYFNTATSQGNASSALTAGSLSPAGAYAAIAGFGEYQGVTYTPGTGWTATLTGINPTFSFVERRTASSGATITGDCSSSSAMDYTAHLAVFVENVQAVPSRRRRAAANHPGNGPKQLGKFVKTKRPRTASGFYSLGGVSATGSTGTVTPSITYALTGVQATGQTGSLTTSVTQTAIPTGSLRRNTRPHPGRGPNSVGRLHTSPRNRNAAVQQRLTGVNAAGTAGTVTPSITYALTGVQATGQAGLVSNGTIPVIGSQVKRTRNHPGYGQFRLGKFFKFRKEKTNPAVGVTKNLTGVSATGVLGTVTSSSVRALTGVAGTMQVGNVVASPAYPLSSVNAVGAVGSVTSAASYSLTSVVGTGSVGAVLAVTGTVLALTGVSATAQVGDVVGGVSYALSGIAATGAVGSVSASAGSAPPPPAPPPAPRPRPHPHHKVSTRQLSWLSLCQQAWGEEFYAPDHQIYKFSGPRSFDSTDKARTGIYGVEVTENLYIDDAYPDMRTELDTDPDGEDIAKD